MPRVTLADARASRIPQVIGACADNHRFLDLINEAQQRLLTKGHWWGTSAKFRICASNSCLTLPRGIATVEAAAVCGTPITVRDFWFEFLEGGVGTRNGGSGCGGEGGGWAGGEMLLRGRYPSFGDVQGTNKKLRFVCDLASDVGKVALPLGYDANGNWLRTQQGGVWSDGEAVPLAQAPGATTANFFSTMTDLQMPGTLNGQVWLYELNTTLNTQRLIGQYQPGETRPSYARYYLPGLCPVSCGAGQPATALVEIMAKLEFIPVRADTDYLIIGNLPALKEMCMALNAAEHEPDSTKKTALLAAGYKAAIGELDSELDHYLGSGRRLGLNVLGSSVGEIDPVMQVW